MHLGDRVGRHEPDIVPVERIIRAGITETDPELHGGFFTRRVGGGEGKSALCDPFAKSLHNSIIVDMVDDDAIEGPLLPWAYGVVGFALLFLVGVLFLPAPIPAPGNFAVFGCYTSDTAPPILLDRHGMHILQPGFPQIGYHLEWLKTGVALAADAPIEASRTGDRFTYSIRPPGKGLFLPFYKDTDGGRDGVFDVRQLIRFTMVGRNGEVLPYEKASSVLCRLTKS